ncbi:MAG: DNA-processing protein DprA [Chloroflexota bacterium]|nr:DNA-processing protein DprA [Chloroflexota bacterium]
MRSDPRYPERLRETSFAPERLWIRGRVPPARTPSVAIVGTRRMTDLGRRMARELAMVLARSGVVIVSGLAQGVDSTAHAAAIAVDGLTVAVLGEGLLEFETMGPVRRRRIASAILERGALLSQFPLDAHGDRWSFPKRNAVVAALGDAVVVVEAPLGSGALITAALAERIGRPLFAIPGPLGAATWLGSNRLISDGRAQLLASADQLAALLRIDLARRGSERSALGPLADRAVALLSAGPADADTIAAGLGAPLTEVATLVAEMLIGGGVVPTGDGRFALR